MKKSFQTSILAIALIASVTGVFVTQATSAPAQAARYNWNGSGPNGSGMLFNRTVAQANSFYGCSSGSTTCAIGNPVSGGSIAVLTKLP